MTFSMPLASISCRPGPFAAVSCSHDGLVAADLIIFVKDLLLLANLVLSNDGVVSRAAVVAAAAAAAATTTTTTTTVPLVSESLCRIGRATVAAT
jgi:hypothetical protein